MREVTRYSLREKYVYIHPHQIPLFSIKLDFQIVAILN